MAKILTKYGALALAVALMVPLAQAKSAGIQTAFGKDARNPFRQVQWARARYGG